MSALAFHNTSLTIVYTTVYSGADQRKHKSSASLAFVRGIHREPVNAPHKGPVARKMFPFDDVSMSLSLARIKGTDNNNETDMTETRTKPLAQCSIFFVNVHLLKQLIACISWSNG